MGFYRAALFLLGIALTSCGGPYLGKDVYGAEEFVLDSYKIREGKFSILEMEGEEYQELDPAYLSEYKDRIHEDDLLQIALFHPKREDLVSAVATIGQSVGYRVTEGAVILPDLSPIYVAGSTLEEARLKIQNKYREEIQDVEVFLSYKDRIARKVELAGLVGTSSIPVDGKIRLFDILSKARIPVEANLFKSYLLREEQFVAVDFYKLLKEGDMSQNIVMRGGDKIYIAEPRAASVMIMGEVRSECVLPVPHGFLPLRQALAEANGIPYTGDKSYIQIIRGNIALPKIYTLSWEHVIHMRNDSLLLIPGDIVYVAPTPITEWNRFISQLLPLCSGVEVVGRTAGNVGIFVP